MEQRIGEGDAPKSCVVVLLLHKQASMEGWGVWGGCVEQR